MKQNYELFIAKVSATLNLLWGITDSSVILRIAKEYVNYKQSINKQLEFFLENKALNVPETFIKALSTNNIFYSFCFGWFKIVPAMILAQGYPVAVLMSDSLKSRQADYFNVLSHKRLKQNGWNTDILFLSHRDPNLLFKMNSLIKSGYKILFYVDGNKGNVDNSFKNMYETTFKWTSNVLFHQGFAWINFLNKSDVLNGLVITSRGNDLVCKHWENQMDKSLHKHEYESTFVHNCSVLCSLIS